MERRTAGRPGHREANPLSSHPRPDVEAVTVRLWAAARQAAGQSERHTSSATIAALRSELAATEPLARVVAICSFLVDGVQADDETAIPAGAIVDVLPPFAGG